MDVNPKQDSVRDTDSVSFANLVTVEQTAGVVLLSVVRASTIVAATTSTETPSTSAATTSTSTTPPTTSKQARELKNLSLRRKGPLSVEWLHGGSLVGRLKYSKLRMSGLLTMLDRRVQAF